MFQEEEFRPLSRMLPPQGGGYGAYNAYITAATRYAALGAPTLYDHPAAMYGGSKFFFLFFTMPGVFFWGNTI